MLEPVTFQYRNHKGSFATRRVIPRALEFIPMPGCGYQPGWFLTGHDVDKQAVRSFALTHISLSEFDFKLVLMFHEDLSAVVPVESLVAEGPTEGSPL